jgi:hypothetical protein
MKPNHERGQTLIELVVLALALGLVVAGSIVAGRRFGGMGYVLGGPLAIGAAYGALQLLVLLENLFWGGIPRIPTCRTGKCKRARYSLTQISSGKWVYQCGCGFRYEKTGRRFVEIDEAGASRPYLKWVPFAGWRHEL